MTGLMYAVYSTKACVAAVHGVGVGRALAP